MAIKYAIRWRPAAYRSTTEAITVNRDPNADPPQVGQRVQTLQLIVFDDTTVGTGGNPYQPGAPATEQHLAIVDEVPIMLDISAFAGKNDTQATALWNAARDAQRAAWESQPDIMALIRAAIGGALSSYVVIG